MHYSKRTAALAATLALSVPSAADGASRAVALSEAREAPSYLRLLAPGQSVTKLPVWRELLVRSQRLPLVGRSPRAADVEP